MSSKKVEKEEGGVPELVEEEQMSNGEGSDVKDYDDWQADEEEEGASRTKCVACGEVLESAEAVLAHMKEKHGFDLIAFVKASTNDASLRMYHYIKLVNYLRTKGDQATIKIEGEAWKSDEYLKSPLEEDPLLFIDIDGDDDGDDDSTFTLPASAIPSDEAAARDFSKLDRQQLEAALLSALNSQSSASQKLATMEQQIAFLTRINKTLLDDGEPTSRARSGSVDSSDSDSSVVKQIDEGYFGSYAGFHIHEDMLKDKVRTEAYRDAIEGNPELFKDKIVLDVGCGTGILSMFAVRAGAKHVIAIDNSGIIERAKEIAAENGFASKITFIRGKAEQIEDLAGVADKVDIIISEWMGYCLLFESMLPSVLFVRDRWLKPSTGVVFPDISSMHVVGMSCPDYRQSRVDFWRENVYGFKMSTIAKRVHHEPHVDHMQGHKVVTDTCKFFECDANVVKPEQLDFISDFKLVVQAAEDGSESVSIDALVTHFDIGFTKNAKNPVWFTTASTATETHWRQTVLLFEHPLSLKPNDVLSGTIQCKANRESFRDLDIHVTYHINGGEAKKQTFLLQ